MVAAESPSPTAIDERALDARLAELRAAKDKTVRAEAARTAGTAMGLGLKIGVELVVSVIVCAAIGWGIDKVAHSAPAGMIVGLFVGFAAGLRNVFRSAKTTSAKWTAAIEADAAAAKDR